MEIAALLLFCFVLGSHGFVVKVAPQSGVDDKIEDAKKAFDETNKFLEKAANSDPGSMSLFDKVLMYGTATGHTLKSVKDLVDIAMILTGSQSESKELKFMKEQFAIINNKLDALDFEFRELHQLIDWNTMRINVGEYEGVITSLEGYMGLMMDAPSDSRAIFEEMFVKAYKHNAGNSAEKIYMAAIADPGSAIFQENIFDVARKFYGNDLRKLSGFVGYILRTIQRGLILETTFFRLTNDTLAMQWSQALWEDRFQEMAKAAERIEQRLYAAVPQQYREDVEKLLLQGAAEEDNDRLSRDIYALLSAKFPFRSWFVLTYSHTDSDKNRFLENCGEFSKATAGKVIAVNSRKRQAARPDLSKVFSKVYYIAGVFQPFGSIAKNLFEIEDSFSCDKYRFKGVIAASSRPVVASEAEFARVRSVYAILAPFIPKEMKLVSFG